MYRKKRASCFLFILFLALTAAFSGCEKKKEPETPEPSSKIVVGFSQVGAESDWRDANTKSMKSALSEENGFDLLFRDGQQKQANQIKAIRIFIQEEADYIVLAPVTETGWDTVLEEAKQAGIPVIIMDRMVDVHDDSLFTCRVGSDFEREGREAGEWLARYLEEKGREEEEINLVTLQGTPGSTAQIGRTEGFAGVLSQHPNWHMLAIENGEYTQSKGREAMERLLKEYPDIDVLVSENDNMTFGAIEAMTSAGRSFGPEGDIIVLSFDAVQAAFDAMQEGEINADFECNPLHGPRVMEIIRDLEAGKEVDKIQYVEETYFDTSMNLEEIRKTREY